MRWTRCLLAICSYGTSSNIEREGNRFSLLILPNVGALSDEQCPAIRRFVERGGSLFATGASNLYNERGDARSGYALADLLGAHRTGPAQNLAASADRCLRTDLVPMGTTIFG